MAKLVYFSLRALGEPVRLILNYAQIPYEETTLERFSDEWTAVKESYPMGQLPVLEIDGVKLHQSKAICRYLAKKCNLNGVNDLEAAQVDIASDVIYDFVMKLRALREIDDEVANIKKYEQFKETLIPYYLRNLDNMVKSNSGYFAVGKLSWVDFYFVGAVDYLSHLSRLNILSEHNNLKGLVEKVLALDNLKKYLSTRPSLEF